mgnify:CR=1 FL=1
MQTTLLIKVGIPAPGSSSPKQEAPLSIEDKVRHAIDMCDSGYSSHVECLLLCKVLDALYQKKRTPRIQNLISMIEPVMAKYGYHKVSPRQGENKPDGR